MIDSPDALKELLPNVSRETIEKLAEFREMILAEDQNLISKNDKNFIWIRHFYDSLRLAKFINSNGNDIIEILAAVLAFQVYQFRYYLALKIRFFYAKIDLKEYRFLTNVLLT